ncbi:MAG TPA: hypothetical protein VJT67_05900 [Longimicrobiaceae bacterium]|nr:hypothetical protein [Longimicrobiaceae bacterium]
MRSHIGGQSRQTAGDDRDPELAKHWRSLRIDTLRAFAAELCAQHTYRGAAALTGLSKEGLRRFVEGDTSPNPKTRQALGEVFFNLYPSGVMETTRPFHGEWQLRRQLIELLPRGEEAAREELEKIFELARRFPDEVPESADLVWEWMDLQIRGEYWAERWVDSFGFRRKRRRDGQPSRKRARPPKPSEELEE